MDTRRRPEQCAPAVSVEARPRAQCEVEGLLDEFPGDVLPEDELPSDELELVPEEAPLGGEALELEPDGLVEDGERGVAVEPALGDEVEPLLLLEPELSQAPSDTAESSAAAISNLLSIRSSPCALSCSAIRSSFPGDASS